MKRITLLSRLPVATALTTLLAIVLMAGPALAYDFPSTNDANRAAGLPHVNQVDVGPGYVTLEFVNDTNSLAFFEIRIDGRRIKKHDGRPHPVVIGDYIYPGISVDSRNIADPVIVTYTFEAKKQVEVRLALGGERDWDFDWTTFDVPKR